MEILDFELVDSLPALYQEETDLLIIGDLHLGLEGAATYEGNYIPQFQLGEVKEDIQKAAEETNASRILINGDLKHEFKYNRFSEKKEIREFIELLEQLFEDIIVIRGNHDTFLEDVINESRLEKSYFENGILYIHGHKALKDKQEYETLVIGHEHPALELEDEIGVTEKVDCFLYGEMKNGKNIVVLPAFSKMAGGSAVNVMPQSELLSPILKNEVDMNRLRAVAVDKEAGVFEFPMLEKI